MFNEHHDENIVSLYQSSSTCVYIVPVNGTAFYVLYLFCTFQSV